MGFGHTAAAREGVSVTRDDAELLLLYDVLQAEQAIDSAVGESLAPEIRDALVSFACSIRPGAFKVSDVARLARDEKHREAAAALETWVRVEQDGRLVVSERLTRRRAAEKALYLKGLKSSTALASAPVPAPNSAPVVAAPVVAPVEATPAVQTETPQGVEAQTEAPIANDDLVAANDVADDILEADATPAREGVEAAANDTAVKDEPRLGQLVDLDIAFEDSPDQEDGLAEDVLIAEAAIDAEDTVVEAGPVEETDEAPLEAPAQVTDYDPSSLWGRENTPSLDQQALKVYQTQAQAERAAIDYYKGQGEGEDQITRDEDRLTGAETSPFLGGENTPSLHPKMAEQMMAFAQAQTALVRFQVEDEDLAEALVHADAEDVTAGEEQADEAEPEAAVAVEHAAEVSPVQEAVETPAPALSDVVADEGVEIEAHIEELEPARHDDDAEREAIEASLAQLEADLAGREGHALSVESHDSPDIALERDAFVDVEAVETTAPVTIAPEAETKTESETEAAPLAVEAEAEAELHTSSPEDAEARHRQQNEAVQAVIARMAAQIATSVDLSALTPNAETAQDGSEAAPETHSQLGYSFLDTTTHGVNLDVEALNIQAPAETRVADVDAEAQVQSPEERVEPAEDEALERGDQIAQGPGPIAEPAARKIHEPIVISLDEDRPKPPQHITGPAQAAGFSGEVAASTRPLAEATALAADEMAAIVQEDEEDLHPELISGADKAHAFLEDEVIEAASAHDGPDWIFGVTLLAGAGFAALGAWDVMSNWDYYTQEGFMMVGPTALVLGLILVVSSAWFLLSRITDRKGNRENT
nr:lysozyme [Woodsholea maritima]